MEDIVKKEYGGCLGTLLPLWLVGQLISLVMNFAFIDAFNGLPLISILLILSNIVSLIGIVLLLKFKKLGFYIFILGFALMLFLGIIYPNFIDSAIILRYLLGLGVFLILMGVKNKETNLNGYQTLGIIKYQVDIVEDASQVQMDNNHIAPNDIDININDASRVEEPLIISNVGSKKNTTVEVFDTVDKQNNFDVSNAHIISQEETTNASNTIMSNCSFMMSKGIKIGLTTIIIIISLLITIVIVITQKNYPQYISSFNDKFKYTFNLPNNQLAQTLFEKIDSLRGNSMYLIVIPGYENEIFESKEFHRVRVDAIREFPSISIYKSITPCTLFDRISLNQYYIYKPKNEEPYARKGSEITTRKTYGTKVYKTVEYNYQEYLKKEIKLVDEAALIPVSDINIIRKIGGFYEKEGIYSKAADYYRFALDYNENSPEIRGMLSYVLALNGESEIAREEAENAIKKDAKEKKALSALALIEAGEYNWKDAKTYAKKVIDYGTDDSNIYYVYCEALYKLGEIKAAQNYYNKAHELHRLNPRRERYAEYAGCPFEVLKFHYCSVTYDGKSIIPYDGKLIKSKCYYIQPKIDVNVFRSEKVRIGVKYYSNGKLSSGTISKDGYTFYEDIYINKEGRCSLEISGWGNNNATAWSIGSNEIEIWYKDKKIAEDSFYIY